MLRNTALVVVSIDAFTGDFSLHFEDEWSQEDKHWMSWVDLIMEDTSCQWRICQLGRLVVERQASMASARLYLLLMFDLLLVDLRMISGVSK